MNVAADRGQQSRTAGPSSKIGSAGAAYLPRRDARLAVRVSSKYDSCAVNHSMHRVEHRQSHGWIPAVRHQPCGGRPGPCGTSGSGIPWRPSAVTTTWTRQAGDRTVQCLADDLSSSDPPDEREAPVDEPRSAAQPPEERLRGPRCAPGRSRPPWSPLAVETAPLVPRTAASGTPSAIAPQEPPRPPHWIEPGEIPDLERNLRLPGAPVGKRSSTHSMRRTGSLRLARLTACARHLTRRRCWGPA